MQDDTEFARIIAEMAASQGQDAEFDNQLAIAESLRGKDYDLDVKDSGRFLSAPPRWAGIAPAVSDALSFYIGGKAAKGKADAAAKRSKRVTDTFMPPGSGTDADIIAAGGTPFSEGDDDDMPYMGPMSSMAPSNRDAFDAMLRKLRGGSSY